MPLRKTAIALPPELLMELDRMARIRRESRNRFITHVLEEAVRTWRDAEVTRRLDELFEDPELRREQVSGAAALDVLGTDWSDESW